VTVVDVASLLQEGLAAHQAGRLADAEACYRRVLSEQPNQPDALHLLAVMALQSGRADEARTLAHQATSAAPDQPAFWNTLGVACQLLGDHVGETAALDRLTVLQPGNARAWGRRGVLAYQVGDLDRALACFSEATRLAPDDAEAWTNLGAVQLRLERLEDAEACQRRAIALRPDFTDAINNLGNVLVARSRWAEAETILVQAVQRAPENPNGWVNLGHALKGQERHANARDAYQRALALRPDDPTALVGLGDAFQGLGELVPAIEQYQQALALAPDDAETHEHLGVAWQRLGRLDEAAAAFRASLALDPDRSMTHSFLIVVLDLQEAAEAEAGQERHRWNARFGRRVAGQQIAHPHSRDRDRPLRVGYVSADFRHHSAAYAILPILRAHDKARVTVVCYSGVTVPDHVTAQLRAFSDVWHDVACLSDDALAAQIRADQIDILVDLSGHSGGNRLPVFAQAPAPVQVTAWGYAASTGLDTVQYFLADPIVVPPDALAGYSEEVVSLPSVLCYEPPQYAPAVSALPASERGHVTFGAFNRLPKISERALATWAGVLAAVPTSRLTIKCAGADTPPGRDWLLKHLAAQGVEPERVTLLGSTPHPDHLAAHGEIDLMLNTFPQNGGITTLDSLLMGVPVVTLLGERVPGRTSASILTTLGRPDLIARTPEEYVAVAAGWAGDLDRLTRERATLRQRLLASPFGNVRTYTRLVEEAYRVLWGRWCDGENGPTPNPLPIAMERGSRE
jgi:predicted O-linked N-acetylglucosamine transferase (SPINDLY family)